MSATLTLAVAKNAELPAQGDYILRDNKTPGLGLRVFSTGVKSWIFQKKLGKSSIRLVLGSFPSLPLESKFNPANGETQKGARQLAEEASAQIRQGLDPRLEKKKQLHQTQSEISLNELTVRRAWDDYVAHKLSLTGKDKPTVRTVRDWEKAAEKLQLSPMWKKPLLDLSGKDLLQEIGRITKAAKSSRATNGGTTQASCIMRYLRASYRFCITLNELSVDDPFKKLNLLAPGWQSTNARSRRIGETEGSMRTWWQAVDNLRTRPSKDSVTIADWLQLGVFFGTRKTELLSLKWSYVDLKNRIIILPDTSTKGRREHVIPLTDHVMCMLKRRHQENTERDHTKRDGTHVGPSEYVFPSSRKGSKTGAMSHLVEPKKTIAQLVKSTGIPFAPHDLRRTFATLLNEGGASDMTVEKALNHAPASAAAKFYVNNPRILQLRKTFQAHEDAILLEAGVTQPKIQMIEVSPEDYELLLKIKAQSN